VITNPMSGLRHDRSDARLPVEAGRVARTIDLRRGIPDLAPEAGWVPSEFCYFDPAWNSKGVSIIERAMRQINNNIDLVEDWFSMTKLSGNCTVDLLTATGVGGFLHFRRDQSAVNVCGFGELNWRGCTIPGSNTVTLSKEYVNAIANDFNDASCGDQDGECACLVADLAGTIIHETMHACFYLTNDFCWLAQQFYMDTFIARQGYSNTSNCCTSQLTSYDPADFDGEADVAPQTRALKHERGEDGRWTTVGCGSR